MADGPGPVGTDVLHVFFFGRYMYHDSRLIFHYKNYADNVILDTNISCIRFPNENGFCSKSFGFAASSHGLLLCFWLSKQNNSNEPGSLGGEYINWCDAECVHG